MEKYKPPMTFHQYDGWKFACLDCGGRGYEEKLSCGCTGYGMRRPCMACRSKGTVTVKMHITQVETQRKFWAEKYKVVKNDR